MERYYILPTFLTSFSSHSFFHEDVSWARQMHHASKYPIWEPPPSALSLFLTAALFAFLNCGVGKEHLHRRATLARFILGALDETIPLAKTVSITSQQLGSLPCHSIPTHCPSVGCEKSWRTHEQPHLHHHGILIPLGYPSHNPTKRELNWHPSLAFPSCTLLLP